MPDDLAHTIDRIVDESLRSKLESITGEISGQLAERLRGECAAVLESSLLEAREGAAKQAAQQAGAEAVQQTADQLLESVRRIRASDTVTGIAGALVDSAAELAARSGLLIHKGESLLGFRLAGSAAEHEREGFQQLSIKVSEAASVAHAIESLDNVVTSGAPGELSEPLAELLSLDPEDRICLFPVKLRDKVLAVLYCDGKGEDGKEFPVASSSIEVLVALAESWIEAVSTRRKHSNGS